jgi:DNA-binding transcriptional ArsR family regulator
MVNQLAEPLDLVFQALADPSRRVMIARLTSGPASVSELARPLTMSMPAVLQHLKVLQDAGLVRSAKVGRVRTCEMNPGVLRDAEAWITDRRSGWERNLDRLGDLLTDEHSESPEPPPTRRTP